MKKRFFSALCLLLTLLLASCDLLGGSLSDYVTEYTQNAALEFYEVPEIFPRDANQAPCISGSFPITLFLRNPMKYQILFEYTFKNESMQTLYDSQYKAENPIQFVQASDVFDAYNMIFPADFIEAIDSGAGSGEDPKDISGTVNAYDKKTLRPFGSIDLKLRADSKPANLYSAIMQLDAKASEQSAKYVVCFEIQRSTHNNDFATIKINNDTWQITYDASCETISNGIKLSAYGGNRGKLIANPDTTEAPVTYPIEEGSDDVFVRTDPEQYDVFYYLTGDQRSSDETLYNITITDKAGLTTTCVVSSRTEKLSPAEITSDFTDGQTIMADAQNYVYVTLSPSNVTTEGKEVRNAFVEYLEEHVTSDGVTFSSGWTPAKGSDGGMTLCLSPLQKGEKYNISVRTRCPGYLLSEIVSLNDIGVIRGNHYFVSTSGSDKNTTGCLNDPFRTFSQCMEAITDYQMELVESYPAFVPSDGFYIDVLDDYIPDDSDSDRLYLLSNSDFSGKLTVQGVDENISATTRTIDAQGSDSNNKGCVSWTNGTLNMKNLQFRGGYLSSASYDTVCYGAGVQIVDSDDSPVTVTLTNCEFEKNIITSTWNRDEDPWPITFCGGAGLAVITGDTRSLVTIDGCSFTGNSASGNSIGAGICILSTVYGNPTGTVIIKGNTTVSYNSIEMFQGAGVYTDGKLIIESATITGNTTAEEKGAGAGFTANTCSDVTIKGKTIIENNTNLSGQNSNAYLACNSDDPENLKDQKTFTIAGDISGSRIGVTTAKQPAVGEPVPFVDGWQASYGQPANFFTSDAGYSITTDISGTLVLAVNSGTGGYHFTEDVTISVSSDNYIPGVEKQITVSASLDGAEPVDITNDVTSWHLELTENGETIPTSWYSVNGNTLTLKQALPRNTYTLYTDIVYNGRHYSDSIAITPAPSVASLTAAPTGGAVTASTASDFARLATWVSGGSSLENVTVLLDSDVTLPADYTGIGFITTENAMISFSGTFDGQGHTVTLDITSDETKRTLGLFGCIKSAHIKNVKVTGLITSNDTSYVAGIAGYTTFGTNCIIENCINEVVINSTSSFSGGIVGMVAADCTIKNCVNNAAISATGNSAGIVGGKAASGGTNTVTLINCINNGNITGLSTGTPGGLIGQITSYNFIIQNCANTGTVKQGTTLKSEIYGGTNATQNNKTYNNVIYLQGSGSGASGNSYYSIYADEIHAETTLSAIVSRLNSWITSQPADERGTYKKWKVSADGTKIVFEDGE